eukprot:3534070-Pleurochrysis_carterae.AAC.3
MKLKRTFAYRYYPFSQGVQLSTEFLAKAKGDFKKLRKWSAVCSVSLPPLPPVCSSSWDGLGTFDNCLASASCQVLSLLR